MKKFTTLFSIFIFGTAFANSAISSQPNSVPNTMPNTMPNQIRNQSDNFPKINNINNETLIVIDCENILFNYVDSAFFPEYKNLLDEFNKSRANLSEIDNANIDTALFNAPHRSLEAPVRDHLENIRKQGGKIIFMYRMNDQKFLVKNKLNPEIKNQTKMFIESLGIKQFLDSSLGIDEGILITDNQKMSEEFSKLNSKNIKRMIFLSAEPLDISKIKNAERVEYKLDKINFQKLSENQIKRQFEILKKAYIWIDDTRMGKISKQSNKEIIFDFCKQYILDVCPCMEINEENIRGKISAIIENEKDLANLNDIIDDFQEVRNNLQDVFEYAGQKCLWESAKSIGVDHKIISEILNEIGISRFNEDDMNLEAHKILKRIASGIHWKDLAKYNYLRNRMQKTSENKTMSEREKNYTEVVNLVFEKIFGNGGQIEDTKNRFIKKLIEKKVEKAKILEFFKISEENLKKIIG